MATFISILFGALATFGRLFGLVLSGRRELENRRRELRLNVLVEAWRSVERAVSRGITENTSALARALADLQLFGSPRQAHQAATAAEALAAHARDVSALDELLEALRVDLRSELRLGRVDGRVVHLRRVDGVRVRNGRRAEATAARPHALPSVVRLASTGEHTN